MMMTGVLLAGVGMPHRVEAAGDRDRNEWRDRRGHDRDRRDARFGRRDRYFVARDVVVIRDYYRPHHRPLPPGLRHRYSRAGYLPRGWAKRMRRVPLYIERDLVVLPRGYHRGIIDGHAVVYDSRGLIIDIAVLF
jgi:hypothetical protein